MTENYEQYRQLDGMKWDGLKVGIKNLNNMNQKKLLLCDMDGVICDFTGHVCTTLGHKSNKVLESRADDYRGFYKNLGYPNSNACWFHLLKIQPDHVKFWEEIPKLHWADEMLAFLQANFEVQMLTTPGRFTEKSKEGKQLWMNKHGYSHIPVNFSNMKHKYAKEGVILIDDMEENVVNFRNAGGIGILMPQHWNSGGHHENPWPIVKKQLEEII